MAYDHNDIYNIVERLAILEGRITPTNVKHGLNKQQKSVPQLPALFKPKDISPVLGAKEKKHPMAGYMVGDDVEDDRKPVEEAVATEDVLDKVKASFADYLKNVADEIKQDTDLKDKKREDRDLGKKDKTDRDLIAKDKVKPVDEESELGSALSGVIPAEQPAGEEGVSIKEDGPVKTVTNECGLWEIHGNEPTGFEIRHGNRAMRSRFKTIEEAEMALEMFAARRRRQDESADYIEEA
jgi:hypothetical protein